MSTETKMDNKFFCGAKYRPETCLQTNNICCLKCEMLVGCTADIKRKNRSLTKKILIPCSSKVISVDEICEFVC